MEEGVKVLEVADPALQVCGSIGKWWRVVSGGPSLLYRRAFRRRSSLIPWRESRPGPQRRSSRRLKVVAMSECVGGA